MTARENEFWTPEPIWHRETVFCLASGPSLTQQVADRIRGRHAIAINTSAVMAPWAEVLFFTDSGWYEPRRDLVTSWPGLVVTMSRTAKRELPDKVRRIKGVGDPAIAPAQFPPLGSPAVRQGRSSGHTAVAVAIAMGAARVVLLGYDMRLVGGREHFHGEYAGPRDLDIYAREFVPYFAGWRAAAEAAGVEVLNCTPGSAVQEFRFAELDEVLA